MFGWYTRRFITNLEAQIAFWQTAWKHERQRGDLLTDRLLHKEHVAPVTGPLMQEQITLADGDVLTAEKLQRAAVEWGNVGVAEPV